MHRSVLYSPGPRGEIQDRYGNVLSRSIPEIRATFLLSELEPVRWVARRIEAILRAAPDDRYPWDENSFYQSLEMVRSRFRQQITMGLLPLEVPWLKNIDPSVGNKISRVIRSRPEDFPGVRLEKTLDGATLLIDPMKLFAGELGIRRLAVQDGRMSADELWAKVSKAYEKVQDKTIDGEKPRSLSERDWIFRRQRHPLLKRMDPDLVIEIALHPEDWPGVYLEEVQSREQPSSPLLGQLIGHVGIPSQTQVKDWETKGEFVIDNMRLKDLRTIELVRQVAHHSADQVGKSGLEAYLEDELRGSPGAHIRTVDVRRRPIGEPGTLLEAKSGRNVQLTLDSELSALGNQWLTDAFVKNFMESSSEPSIPESVTAALVVLDVNTGEILGLSSLPQLGQEIYQDSDLYRKLSKSTLGYFYDRCIGWSIDPGSTFKPMVALMGFSQGVISPEEKIPCQGVFDPRFPEKNKCNNHLFGEMDIQSAISKSCNVYFYEVGQRLGLQKLQKGAEEFGFWTRLISPFSKNGITSGVLYQESKGVRPEVNPVGTAIGRGFEVTPLQIAYAAMLLARRGDVIPLSLFMGQKDSVTERIFQEKSMLSLLSKQHYDVVIKGMIEATKTGTARKSDLEYFRAAVKTGTVKLPSGQNRRHAWMMGFAPAKDPEVAFAVVLQDQPGSGGSTAPVIEKLLEWLETHRQMRFRS